MSEKNLEALNIDIDNYLNESVEYNIYRTEDLTFDDTLGNSMEEVERNYLTSMIPYSVSEMIMTISDYNNVAKIYNNEEYTLNDDEYMIIADYDSMIQIRNIAFKE